MATIAKLGRLPEPDEFPLASEIVDKLGSMNRAFALVKRVTGTDEWDAIARRCTEDLLVYLALGRFRRRPPMTALPLGLQRDIRAFFGSYAKACRQADDLLFRAGNAEAVDETCRQSPVGKLLPNALYVHRSALDSLDPLLRVYEGCARSYLGEVDGANLIKLHRHSGKVSYLVYPEFETDPHPAVVRSVKLSLRTREIECFDYAGAANPPILHCKETFLTADHPLHGRFARLTAQEEKHGLLDEPGDDRYTGRLASATERRGVYAARTSAGAAQIDGSRGISPAYGSGMTCQLPSGARRAAESCRL